LAQKKINIMLLWKPALFSKINYQGFYCFSVACSQWKQIISRGFG
jgi:hypothetical protein